MKMSSFLRKNRKSLIVIFFVAFVFRLVFSIPVFINIERAIGPGSDAKNYITLAEHLLSEHEFSVYSGETGYREAARTPGYPLFIAFSYLLSGKWDWLIIVMQCLLDALISLMIFSIGIVLLHSVNAALFAGLLYSVHPHQALYTSQILSETLFTFLITICLTFLIAFLLKKKKILIIISGLLLGIATLTRPISIYFFIPIILIIIIALRTRIKSALYSVLFFLMAFFLALSPWYVRNYITYHKVFLSTIGNWNIGYYNAAFVISLKEGISLIDAQQKIAEAVKRKHDIKEEDYYYVTDNPEMCKYVAQYGLKVIRQNPLTYAVLHTAGFVHTFLPSEYAFLYKVIGTEGIKRAEEAGPIVKNLIANSFRARIGSAIKMLFKERFAKFPVWFSIVWLTLSIFELFIYFFAAKGFGYFAKQDKILFLLFLFTILYFSALPGPVGDPRFRVPIEPVIVLLAGAGFLSARKEKREERM